MVQPICTDEVRRMFAVQSFQIMAAVRETMLSLAFPTSDPQQSATLPSLITKALTRPPFNPLHNSTSFVIEPDRRGIPQAIPTSQSISSPPSQSDRPAPDSSHIIPHVARGEAGWRQVVSDWQTPDPTRSLLVALKDWPKEWYSGSSKVSKTVGSLYSQRRSIALEYLEVYVPEFNLLG